ncbi:E3 ubiquitin-protein ligase TRIM39-like [Sebastes umbrosus]|uniref:E3 ubiquitin-protein ligase TRIM39-like n=1 Tax=Sebastes umbrosus TaxID=72105 RepID=UPI00189E5C54|nr:E3 ubiquitin-protein ligase TRIM39-like [Sebastes umbrosus]XP_037616398.1 E3 ubiquitin-protein ligase TRIM39-like [Sebastes umbrosus]
MATASSLLSEEKFLCSVCLDVFTKPVTTPCGHNFCSACIQKYWDGSDICQCPLCNRTFSQRPELQVNTFISELAAEFKMLAQVKASTPDPHLPGTADVLCDICSEMKENAVKSCLTCLVSFCEEHLEPHQRVAALKSHTLSDPVKNLDDRMCKTHNKITELYCRTDKACICALCFKTDHKSHNVVPLEEEYEAAMAKKDETMANIQKMIQSRSEKIAEIENSVDVGQREAEKEKEASVQIVTDLIRSIQRSQAELVEAIEERYRATKQKAEGFLTELRMEVAELESRSEQLEQLSQSEDHHHFLQSFPNLCSPLNKDWANIGVHSDLCFEAVRGAVTLLKQRVDEIMEELPEIKMKRMREHAVDLTFDPDTAFYSLVISQDGKQVINTDIDQNLPNNPKRFEMCFEVLAKEGFTTGKFYYEVQVKGKTKWVVGVVRESVDRKESVALSDENGYWTIMCDEGKYSACTSQTVKITLKEKLQKVGIFVDYNKRVVSFYDVNSKSHIYSYIGYNFTEKLYPYFCPQENANGANSAPLIITPVPQTP